MEQAILDSIIEEYKKLTEKNKEINKKRKRLSKLMQHRLVKEYIKLYNEVNAFDGINAFHKQNYKSALTQSFRRFEYNIKETNGIYVYLGTFKYTDEVDIVHGEHDDRVNRDDPKADYSLYRNIENHNLQEDVKIKDRDEFERTHTIICGKNQCFPDMEYWKIQEEFYELVIKKGQEVACKEIIKKYQ